MNAMPRRVAFAVGFLAVLCAASLCASSAQAITLTGVRNLIGAEAFINAGYDGDGVIVANVEAGHAFPTHQALDQSIQHRLEFPGLDPLPNQSHATQTAGPIVAAATLNNGSPTTSNGNPVGAGVAAGATLWTGRIATTASGSSFSVSVDSTLWPYLVGGEIGINDAGVVGGAGAKTADVFSGSWGASDSNGATLFNVVADYLANSQGKTMVFAAGNSNSGSNLTLAPANGWNTIAVGATNAETPNNETVWSSSGGGTTGSLGFAANSRTKPDLVAPGVTVNTTTGSSTAMTSQTGTSLATPIVAGGAALMIDAGKATGRSTDPRLVKAILMNSATKLDGWQQVVGFHPTNGTRINSTPVDGDLGANDKPQGAGRINLSQAFTEYMSASSNGTGAGNVGGVGWDVNTVSDGLTTDYIFDGLVQQNSMLTATLIWFMDREVEDYDHTLPNPAFGPDDTEGTSDDVKFFTDSFDDLDLYLYQVDPGGTPIGDAVAASISGWDSANPDDPGTGWDSVEHLHLNIAEEGRYMLRVQWTQELFDNIGDANVEDFALAWNLSQELIVVPEGGSFTLAMAGMLLMAVWGARRRQRNTQAGIPPQ